MTDQKTPQAECASLLSRGLGVLFSSVNKLFAHKHRWVDSGFNRWSIATEQRCKCGAYRHHLWDDVEGDVIAWRDGKHPKTHNLKLGAGERREEEL